MPLAVFALAAINIAIGTQNFVFVGLLSELAHDLGISIGTAGLLVPASSITFAVAAPFATALVSRIERKRVMMASLAILALCNALCVGHAYVRLAAGVANSWWCRNCIRRVACDRCGHRAGDSRTAWQCLRDRRGRAHSSTGVWRSPRLGDRWPFRLAHDLRLFGGGMRALGAADRGSGTANQSATGPPCGLRNAAAEQRHFAGIRPDRSRLRRCIHDRGVSRTDH